jgi:ribosomal protein L44E
MKIESEIRVYCPYCNKHTPHKVKFPAKNAQRGLSFGTRKHLRRTKGYVGSVAVRLKPKKLGKRQKMLLECKECKKSVERIFGKRTKKKLEIKR